MKLISKQLNVIKKENEAKVRILKKYQKLLLMFREKAYEKLSEHWNWDNKIPIEEGKKLNYGFIYALPKTKLKVLKKYLNKNLYDKIRLGLKLRLKTETRLDLN